MDSFSVQQIKSLMDVDGQPNCGYLTSIPESLDLVSFRYFSSMDRPKSALSKYLDYKQFQFVSLFTPDYVVGIAIADIRYLGSSFCYLYDIKKDVLKEHSWIRPGGLGYSLTASPWQGVAQFNGGQIRFEIEEGEWTVRARCPSFELDARLGLNNQDSAPLMVCSPTGYSGWTYTQKHNALAVTGSLIVGGHSVDLEGCLGGYDFSAGYMRRETSWRWASMSAFSDGVYIGLNLAAGVNETGVTENAIWINGERFLLSGVMFDFDRHSPESNWRIYDSAGKLDLTFTPLNVRKEKLNLWLLKSNFRQFVGHFSGTITVAKGRTYHLSQVMGLTEDHFAKW